jgi:hypothetical protein
MGHRRHCPDLLFDALVHAPSREVSMNRRPNLRAVPPATEPPLDIGRAMRAEIMERDGTAVHIAGDRAKPLPFFERIKRTWWK